MTGTALDRRSQPAAPAAPTTRPQRPPRSRFAVGLALGSIAFTVLTVRSTGFSLRDVFEKLGNTNPVLSALPNAELSQIFSPRSREAFVETLRLAVLAAIAGSIVSLPFAVLCTQVGAPWWPVRTLARVVSSVIRAIPEVVWAALFVAAVGIGALPGLLALFFFTIAVVTKLTADTLDGVDLGPVEAADATGAGHASMLRTAVVPQIMPAYTSYALYAFELNIRGSAVLGFVGAGGIGSRIQFFQSQNDWERMWGITVMFIIVVFVIDRISTYLRRRLV